MTLTVTAPPPAEPVSLDAAKAHLRVTFDDEDDLIATLLLAARERVEAATGLCLATTGLSQTGPLDVGGAATLLRGPLVGVDAAALAGGAGGCTPLPASSLQVEADGPQARVRLTGPTGQGAFAPAPPDLRIDYRAGFAVAPAGLVQAVLAILADAYARRGDGEPPSAAVAQAWLAPYRAGRL